MIISHRHKFIFIKNRKVGSTSTEVALQKICGPEDILTPDSMWGRESDVLLPQAKNYHSKYFPLREIIQNHNLVDTARALRDMAQRPKFYNHMRASSVRARISRKVWDTYYKFCFDRNPWDKTVSFYYWFGRRGTLPPFNEYLRNHRKYGTNDQTLPSDWTRYTLRNTLIVDDVFDYADLESGLRTALTRAGVEENIINEATLGTEKTAIRKKRSVEFDPDVDAIIRRAFRNEILTFPFCASPPSDI
ncbi:MAG: sulfotransferase family 2 domain-containing protein [Tateyamaria sp.]|uniref:sulfotransferase family 2 domain-containing protein n=1 Tax=Rhodobacterales TaxID=204455 RepID=UPI00326AB8C4